MRIFSKTLRLINAFDNLLASGEDIPDTQIDEMIEKCFCSNNTNQSDDCGSFLDDEEAGDISSICTASYRRLKRFKSTPRRRPEPPVEDGEKDFEERLTRRCAVR